MTERFETCGINEGVKDIIKTQFTQLVDDQLLSRVNPIVMETTEEDCVTEGKSL